MAGAGLAAALGGEAAVAEPWIATVGGRVSGSPKWEGSDDMRVRVAPTLAIRRASPRHRFTPPDPGATLDLIDTRYVTAGPVLAFRRERQSKDELAGLRHVRRAIEPGVFVDLWPADWLRIHLQGRKGVRGHKGWAGDAGVDVVYSRGRWDASLGPRVGYASDRFMDAYFEVTPEEAALSPAVDAAYSPSGGARYLGVQAAVLYRLDDRWRITVDGRYQRLAEKAADSPIVRTLGSRDQFIAGVTLDYSFSLGF